MTRFALAFAFAVATASGTIAVPSHRGSSLLSGNATGEAFSPDIRRIETGATLSWIANGDFSTDKGIVATQRDRAGRQRVLNGRLVGDGDASVWGTWGGGAYRATAAFDLQTPHLVESATVWSAEKRGTWGMAEFSVALSSDGQTWFDAGVCRVPPDYMGKSDDKPKPEPFDLVLEKPAVARFVRVCVRKNPNRHQMVVGEIAIWGDEAPEDSEGRWAPANSRPGVHPALRGIGSGALMLDWRDYAVSGAKGFRVYASNAPFRNVRDDGVESIGATGANERRFLVRPLRPKVARHYAVAPVFADGESAQVESVGYSPPETLDVSRFGDMLAINHYWGGGGASEGPLPQGWNDVVLDILATTPFRAIRWWTAPENIVRKYHDRGIEVTSWVRKADAANAIALGIRVNGFGNEPHLTSMTPEQCAERSIASRAEWEAQGAGEEAGFEFYGPTIGIEDQSINYLDRFLAAGGGDACTVFDFHDYVSTTAEFAGPEGYSSGAPEAIPARVAKVREVLEKHGQGAKPLICSEWGYSDCRVHNAHGDITPLRKAQFLVRGSIIHFVLGFRRLFIYSFYDEGTDPGNPEHFFGLVSRDLQKKPAFYAMQTLGEVLGDTVLNGSHGELDTPDGDYGFVFRNVAADGTPTGGHVSVFWNGARERAGLFRTAPGEVEIVSMLGERRTIRTGDDGTFRVRFGASPVYLRAASPVTLVEAKDAAAPDGASISGKDAILAAAPQTGSQSFDTPRILSLASADGDVAVRASGGGKQRLVFSVCNETSEKIDVRLLLRDGGGEIVATARAESSPDQKTEVAFDVDPGPFRLQRYTLAADYEADGETRREECPVWLRVIGPATGGAARFSSVRFANLEDPVLALESDELEVTVLPQQGGEILEIFDKRTFRNQVALDYEDLPRLGSIPFANGVWDQATIKGEGVRASFGRHTPFVAEPSGDGSICMTANLGRGVAVAKTLRLEGDRLSWKTVVSNGAPTAATVDWHLHPEYVPGGTADSYSDVLTIPKADGPLEIPFWSGLGERRIGDAAEGWWELRDPAAKYTIRQDYDLSAIPTLRLWFGPAAANVELLSIGRAAVPGESVSFKADWCFGRH